MSVLRNDSRQWQIYSRESVVAVIKGLEMLALGAVGKSLTNHPSIQLRAVGNVMVRLSNSRMRFMLGLLGDVPDEERAAAEAVVKVSGWLAEGGEEPTEALDELHAAVFWFDSQMKVAGMKGSDWIRTVARGNHGW